MENDLSFWGSISSVLGFLLAVLTTLWWGIERYRKALKVRNKYAIEFGKLMTRMVVGAADETVRFGAGILFQIHLGRMRHLVIKTYIQWCLFILAGGIGFIVFNDLGMLSQAWAAIAYSLVASCVMLWVVSWGKSHIVEAENQVTTGLVDHLIRDIDMSIEKLIDD